MKKQAELYIERNFKKIKLLHKSEKSEIWLVSNQGGVLYVLKYMKYTGVPYAELKNIAHIVLPKIIHVTIDDQQTVVVEEYINGQNMNTFVLGQNFLDEELAKNIMLQLCEGLAVLHEANIIHRDIKPSNLILTSNDEVKLIDFDVARLEKVDAKGDTRQLGTKGYAPPEQYGFSQTDCRSDIYALGITMKELLGSSYKGDLCKVLNRCTELNPKDRFQSMKELKEAVQGNRKRKYFRLVSGCIMIGIVMGGFLYMYESPKDVKPKMENRQLLPTDVDKAAGDENQIETKNLIIKPANEENQSQENIASVPMEKNQPQMGKTQPPLYQEQKRSSISYDKVQITTYCAGSEMNGFKFFDVVFDDWKSWRKEERDYVYLPKGTAVEITIENDSGQDIINPTLVIYLLRFDMDYDVILDIEGLKRERNRFTYKNNVIATGEKVKYRLPLENAYINVCSRLQPTVGIRFWADNYPLRDAQVNFKLNGL